MTTSPHKMLHVFEAIMLHGPVKPTDLSNRLDIPKSTVSRLIQALESKGWIQRTIGGHGFVVTYDFHKRVQKTNTGAPGAADIKSLIENLSFRQNYHIDLYVMEIDGPCQLIESTDTTQKTGHAVPLTTHTASHTVLASLRPVDQIRIISNYLKYATPEEKSIIQNGQLSAQLNLDPIWGCMKSAAGALIGLPLQFSDTRFGALIVRPRKPRHVRFETFEKILTEIWALQTQIPDLNFPKFDTDIIATYLRNQHD